jgi:hypothetical protein
MVLILFHPAILSVVAVLGFGTGAAEIIDTRRLVSQDLSVLRVSDELNRSSSRLNTLHG